MSPPAWAIVLGAGRPGCDGGGVPVPDASFGLPRALLRAALDRAASVVPIERVVVVVADEHRRSWQGLLADLAPQNVVVEPHDRGTAPSILLPFLHVFRRDRSARVLVLPSGQYVHDEPVLHRALAAAAEPSARHASCALLLGMALADAEVDHAWILPSPRPGCPARDVSGYVERPDAQTAGELRDLGALVSSGIFAADSGTLLALYEEANPNLLRAFLRGLRGPQNAATVEDLYETIEPTSFSRDVLERVPDRLAVLPVAECGWRDLGTQQRVERFEVLRRSGQLRARRPVAAATDTTRPAA